MPVRRRRDVPCGGALPPPPACAQGDDGERVLRGWGVGAPRRKPRRHRSEGAPTGSKLLPDSGKFPTPSTPQLQPDDPQWETVTCRVVAGGAVGSRALVKVIVEARIVLGPVRDPPLQGAVNLLRLTE